MLSRAVHPTRSAHVANYADLSDSQIRLLQRPSGLGRHNPDVGIMMRGYAPDPGLVCDGRDGVSDALFADPPAALDEQPRLAQTDRPVRDPLIEQVFELGVQRDVAVGAEFPERHVQPVRGADLHDRVDSQIEELSLAKPGPGEKLDREPGERVRMLTRRAAASPRRRRR
jgi:hypothetical protein